MKPVWVFGLHTTPLDSLHHPDESMGALWALVDSKMIPGPDFMGFVDCLDFACADITAYEALEAGGQRFSLAQHFNYQCLVDAMRKELPEYAGRFPEGSIGAGKQQVKDKTVHAIDGSKGGTILGLEHTSLSRYMKDSWLQLCETEEMSV